MRSSIPVALLLGACSPSSSNEAAGNGPGGSGRPITIETIDGRPDRAFLVPPDKMVRASDLAAAVRETGYPCDLVTEFSQLEQNGRALDVYKIDCPSGSYQVTVLPTGTRIKPWTGKIFG